MISLFAGCGPSSSGPGSNNGDPDLDPEPNLLEGVWKATEMSASITDRSVTLEFPMTVTPAIIEGLIRKFLGLEEEQEVPGMSEMPEMIPEMIEDLQPYFELKEGKVNIYLKVTIEGQSKLYIIDSTAYSTKEDKITIVDPEEDSEIEDIEAAFSITGNTIVMTSSANIPMEEDTEPEKVDISIKAVKVDDSEVEGAEPRPGDE